MATEIIEPEIVVMKCGVCTMYTVGIKDEKKQVVESCEEDAICTISIEDTNGDPALLPVCELHSKQLEEGHSAIIREQNGERNFQIQFAPEPESDTGVKSGIAP